MSYASIASIVPSSLNPSPRCLIDPPSPPNEARHVYDPSRDFFAGENASIINTAMSKLKPHNFNATFKLLQFVYKHESQRFNVYSGIHQNNATDPLHMSVNVDMDYGAYIILHINGFWKNRFIVTHITLAENGGMTEIARFQ